MKCDVRQIITNICAALCAKESLDSNFKYAVIDKLSILNELAPNFTYLENLIVGNQFFHI